jgi:hypothetical protein
MIHWNNILNNNNNNNIINNNNNNNNNSINNNISNNNINYINRIKVIMIHIILIILCKHFKPTLILINTTGKKQMKNMIKITHIKWDLEIMNNNKKKQNYYRKLIYYK